MNIGIIGSGNMGSGLGKLWAKSGHSVLFSFSREQETLKRLAEEAGGNAQTGTPAEAAVFADVVLLAVPWQAVDTALAAAGPLTGKTLISCVNPLLPDLSGLAIGTTTSGAEEIAKKVPGAVVVEAFLNIFAGILHSGEMQFGAESPSVFYCGDDVAAKAVVAQLIRDIGLEDIDSGLLKNARFVEPTAMLVLQLGVFLGFGKEWRPGEFSDVALKLMRR